MSVHEWDGIGWLEWVRVWSGPKEWHCNTTESNQRISSLEQRKVSLNVDRNLPRRACLHGEGLPDLEKAGLLPKSFLLSRRPCSLAGRKCSSLRRAHLRQDSAVLANSDLPVENLSGIPVRQNMEEASCISAKARPPGLATTEPPENKSGQGCSWWREPARFLDSNCEQL
jgi:hypothetical protein